MNYKLAVILSFSVAIPAVIGWIRFNRIGPAYYPFLLLMSLGFCNELTSFLLTRNGHSNAVNSNIYALGEGMLIMIFFYRVNLFNRKKWIFISLLQLLITTWIIDKFIISDIHYFSSYYTLVSAFVYVLCAISMINRLALIERQKLARNSVFVISLCFIFFFTYALLVEIFVLYGAAGTAQFQLNVYRIMAYINVGVNLMYTLAILWIPRKQEYSLL